MVILLRSLAAFTAFVVFGAGASAQEQIALSKLTPAQKVVIEYGLAGGYVPFGAKTYELTITGAPKPIISVAQIGQKWSEEKSRMITVKSTPVGSYLLAPKDLAAVDAVLRLYQRHSAAGPPRHTGNIERVIVRLMDNEKVQREELHWNEPGQPPGGQSSLPSLIRKAAEAKQASSRKD